MNEGMEDRAEFLNHLAFIIAAREIGLESDSVHFIPTIDTPNMRCREDGRGMGGG